MAFLDWMQGLEPSTFCMASEPYRRNQRVADGMDTAVASVAGPLLMPAAAGARSKHWFTIGGRLHFSVPAPAAAVLLWWATYCTLIGSQF
jgi:hypothetical protein